VDRHRFDTDPDLDPTFPYDAADPDPTPIPSFTHIRKSEFFSTFIYSSASLNCVVFVVSKRYRYYLLFNNLEIFSKRYSSALDLVEMDTNPVPVN
jgi:hypothetical protein